MLSRRQECAHMMIHRCSSSSNGRKEWSAQISSQCPSKPSATAPAAGARAAVTGHGTIRVIHIFPPKIIKTDAANFKQLVQKLTGNSSSKRSSGSKGKASKRGGGGTKAKPPSSYRGQQILSQYRNATQIFASSSRVEYIISRSPAASSMSPKPYFWPAPTTSSRLGVDFLKQEDPDNVLVDIKPMVTLREPSFVDYSNCSSDQSCSSPFLPIEVTSPHNSNYLSNQMLKDSSNIFCPRSCTSTAACTPARSVLETCRGNQEQRHHGLERSSCSQLQPLMVDPFQSLSGYKEKLFSPPPKSSSTSTTGLPLLDDKNHDQGPTHAQWTSRFSEMEILTGLVKPGPNQHQPDTLSTWSTHLSCHNTPSPDFTFPNGHLNNSSSLCRFSIQSPLRGGVSQLFENF